MAATSPGGWSPPVHFGLIVTGKGEERFLCRFLRALTKTGRCSFRILGRIGQRAAVTSMKRKLEMIGHGKSIPDRDQEMGLWARGHIDKGPLYFALLVDDLEKSRRENLQATFDRYRQALDAMLISPERRARAAVHFLVNMVEAYYFAHAQAVNMALGRAVLDGDWAGDVEEIPHPKNKLCALFPGFNEVDHGSAIVQALDLDHVLSRPETCRSLRSLVRWCTRATSDPLGPRFCLEAGLFLAQTDGQ